MKKWILTLCAAAAMIPGLGFAWLSKVDSKPVAELQLMTELELAQEASRPCGALVSDNAMRQKYLDYINPRTSDANRYLETIGRVVRQKKGRMPKWMTLMTQASEGKDAGQCIYAYQELLEKR